jgi:hypothetical protein
VREDDHIKGVVDKLSEYRKVLDTELLSSLRLEIFAPHSTEALTLI